MWVSPISVVSVLDLLGCFSGDSCSPRKDREHIQNSPLLGSAEPPRSPLPPKKPPPISLLFTSAQPSQWASTPTCMRLRFSTDSCSQGSSPHCAASAEREEKREPVDGEPGGMWPDPDRRGRFRLGQVRLSLSRSGLALPGLARPGPARLGPAQACAPGLVND